MTEHGIAILEYPTRAVTSLGELAAGSPEILIGLSAALLIIVLGVLTIRGGEPSPFTDAVLPGALPPSAEPAVTGDAVTSRVLASTDTAAARSVLDLSTPGGGE